MGDVIVIGAGPAGLTAALELIRAGRRPVVVEADTQVGGISKTINHHGNRMDLGGHRFFSKSDWVMEWWRDILPLGPGEEGPVELTYQQQSRVVQPSADGTLNPDQVMLVRPRLSRIYYLRRFFDYPVKLNANTIRNLGPARMAKIGAAYTRARLFPRKPERTLEDFLINRFGRELYATFFRDYTEKVWGVPCGEISAAWGAQRIKGLSITKALLHAARQVVKPSRSATQEGVETSLIERFLYPKFGPGQLWERVADLVTAGGGRVLLRHAVTKVVRDGFKVRAVSVVGPGGAVETLEGEAVISTMAIKDLAAALTPSDTGAPIEVARQLPYRDFLTVGLLVPRMFAPRGSPSVAANGMPADNWIYIQEPDVRLGRLQIFNNWSPAMVGAHPKIWVGLEYFVTEGDRIWSTPDPELIRFAANELEKIGLIRASDVEDSTIVRVKKAYPAYFGAYARFDEVQTYFDRYENLYLVGRNGMHRYNNQDHSMLSAKAAVDCIVGRGGDKRRIWDINVEQEYHEEK